ncbi:hypothetical protein QC761_301310 [Podospora bellae-mahoneyi]|uniref:Uncharacterized protein n=1 Tax=Podospora bellae-mahoneyi TaxID=2093777 RepID=A0ABR0FJA6_9PEZI|nr:hypothetical protein QC761_301310 [Podospora bellae-mahoneyi]
MLPAHPSLLHPRVSPHRGEACRLAQHMGHWRFMANIRPRFFYRCRNINDKPYQQQNIISRRPGAVLSPRHAASVKVLRHRSTERVMEERLRCRR